MGSAKDSKRILVYEVALQATNKNKKAPRVSTWIRKSYFIWARIPQRHASNLRNLQGLNREIPDSYTGNWPYCIRYS